MKKEKQLFSLSTLNRNFTNWDARKYGAIESENPEVALKRVVDN